MRSVIALAVLFVIAAQLLSHPHAYAAAVTLTVNSLADTDDGSCDHAPDCTLREAIKAANSGPGDTIDFTVTGAINLTGALPDITDDVTINGPGASLLTVRRDTGGDYRIFNVIASGVVTFSGITISNGRLSVSSSGGGGGAGINNASSGTVNVTNCTLTDNSTVFSFQPLFISSGGGIFNGPGTLNVTNSTLSNNSNGGFGGGSGDGGAIANSGTATITNCSLSNNGSAGRGAAIYNEGSMTVDSSILSDNSARLAGGIYNAGMLDVTSSTLSNNSAPSNGGGGIYDAGGTLNVTNSTLSDNSASEGGGIFSLGTVSLTSSTLSNNSASNNGGGVVNSGPSMTMESCIVALNTAPTSPNLSGVIASQGHNAVGDTSNSTFIPGTGDQIGVTTAQLNLGVLQNNGGPTPTIALGMGSVAIDAGADAVTGLPLNLTTDQRGTGFPRLSGIHVDVGAFELQQLHVGPPRNKDQCKNGGWRDFDTPRKFNNQGDCIQFVNTGR
jgi:CSLREA domain-containing protein